MKNRKTLSNVCLLILLASPGAAGAAVAQKRPAGRDARSGTQLPKGRAARGDEALKVELEALLKLPLAERVAGLRAFLEANPRSSLRTRATEQLVSAHAALGDERLQAQDAAAGVELFKQAVALAPAEMSDKLYYEVVSQLPANLFLRGQTAAALELARAVETKAGADTKRLLALAAFYVSVEQADEAARIAKAVIAIAPEQAAAHQALGAAHRLALRLDEAAAEYARAVELDPRSAPARRSLADLRRATGKPEEALTLYRGLVAADPNDPGARTGVALSLFEAGKREEAERELEAALTAEPRNLLLLVGAAYWYAAHDEKTRALELAGQAVRLEPRFTWAQIALARALIANKLPLDAERALRYARQYGRFPTLDYELANALAAAGLYDEALDELARSFTLRDGQLETRLAGKQTARAASFIELLAPERRASIFQAGAADTEANARMLKSLLALNLALDAATNGQARAANQPHAAAAAAANDFTAGTDEMRAFRQLYAASRLLRRGVALQTALELTDAARANVEAAIDAPEATAATTADELRDTRAAAIAQGSTPNLPLLPRNAISNILRGRVEELAGMALLGQGRTAEAVVALRRAVSVLPERSLYWRTAQWRLGTALASGGQERDALAAYIKSYNPATPDAARRAVIESLYTKVNGSPAGLDAQIGPAPARLATLEAVSANASATPAPVESPAPAVAAPAVEATPEPPVANTSNAPAAAPTPSPQPETEATPAPTSTPTPAPTQSPAPVREKRTGANREACTLVLSAGALELRNSGGSAGVVVSLEGSSDLAGINAATANWSDIIILREPQGNADTNSLKFTVTSISKNTGNFDITFKSPCGAQKLTVTVR
jgi:Flp pilus assembly protein TadD